MAKKFRVWAKTVDYCYLDVEADSKEEAMEVAEEADGGAFHNDWSNGEWEFVDEVEEINDDSDVDYTYSDFFKEAI